MSNRYDTQTFRQQGKKQSKSRLWTALIRHLSDKPSGLAGAWYYPMDNGCGGGKGRGGRVLASSGRLEGMVIEKDENG